ncbi:hypothetical protein [Streptomyces sp. NBC_01618]|uniref:hypothetical protein n=1 Tax=Streptomyces sp. NBC_01618 TaxID=2975900 RepID=UPI0038660B73|nr:hypothetical protein OH735_14840 [Streptomyces sp. NBC_01618]
MDASATEASEAKSPGALIPRITVDLHETLTESDAPAKPPGVELPDGCPRVRPDNEADRPG